MADLISASTARTLAKTACHRMYDLEVLFELVSDAIKAEARKGNCTLRVSEELLSKDWNPRSRSLSSSALDQLTSEFAIKGFTVTQTSVVTIVDGAETTLPSVVISW